MLDVVFYFTAENVAIRRSVAKHTLQFGCCSLKCSNLTTRSSEVEKEKGAENEEEERIHTTSASFKTSSGLEARFQ